MLQTKKQLKKKVGGDLETIIAAIERRMQMREVAFLHESKKDQQKLDELKLQQEGLTLIK